MKITNEFNAEGHIGNILCLDVEDLIDTPLHISAYCGRTIEALQVDSTGFDILSFYLKEPSNMPTWLYNVIHDSMKTTIEELDENRIYIEDAK